MKATVHHKKKYEVFSGLTQVDLDHVSKLANLPVTREQASIFLPQLSNVLSYVVTVNEPDTNDVSETAQVTGAENVFRDDEIQPTLSQEQALQNAPETHNGYIVVKRIFEEK